MIETLAVPLRQKKHQLEVRQFFLGKQTIFPQEIFSKRVFAAFAKFSKQANLFYVLMSDMGVKQESNKRSMNFFRK